MKKSVGIVLLLVALFSFWPVLAGCQAPPIQLNGVEIREYQGQKLDSVNDFRENSIRGPQHIDIANYRLEINGLVENLQSYAYDDVIKQYQPYKKVISLNCVEGWSAKVLWEGILVKDLLAKVKPFPSAKVVIFHAYDTYTTSLPIDYLVNNDIIMAYKMNEVTLPVERGYPFELAAESKWGYKWIRWVVRLELSDNVDYRGYWEDAGYSNNADLDKEPFSRP